MEPLGYTYESDMPVGVDTQRLLDKVIQEALHRDRGTFDGLNQWEKDVVARYLADAVFGADSGLSLREVLWEIDYDQRPVSIEEFIESDEYFGRICSELHPLWKRDLSTVFAPGSPIFEWLFTGAIGVGKGHPVDAPVLTPKGWVKVGDVREGDRFIGSDGKPVQVDGVYPRGRLPVYRVRFTDGASVTVDGDHLWAVQEPYAKYRGGGWKVKSTLELLAQGVKTPRGQRRWHVPMTPPIRFDRVSLPIRPYVLGALIGNGGLSNGDQIRFSTVDMSLLERVCAESGLEPTHVAGCDYRLTYPEHGVNPVLSALRDFGLCCRSEKKRIPPVYLRGSVAQRRDLLRGLMDTDGWVQNSGKVSLFSTSSPGLAGDVGELVRSLGGVTTRTLKKTEGLDAHVVCVNLPCNPFWLARKASEWRAAEKYKPARMIDSIEPAGEAEVVCFSVDADDELYVAQDYVVTHNTTVAMASMGYKIHCLGCLRDPAAYYGLLPDSLVVFGIYSITKRQVADTGYFKLKGFIDSSPWFRFQFPRSLKIDSKIEFLSKNVQVIPGCLAEGTRILTTGGYIPIEELAGDAASRLVWAQAGDSWDLVQAPYARVVESGIQKCLDLELEDGQTITCTPEHRIRVEDHGQITWKKAGDVRYGDRVLVLRQDEAGLGVLSPTWASDGPLQEVCEGGEQCTLPRDEDVRGQSGPSGGAAEALPELRIDETTLRFWDADADAQVREEDLPQVLVQSVREFCGEDTLPDGPGRNGGPRAVGALRSVPVREVRLAGLRRTYDVIEVANASHAVVADGIICSNSREMHALGLDLFSFCLSGDHVVWTDGGPVPIGSMVSEPKRVWTWDGSRYSLTHPIRAVCSGWKRTVPVTLSNGQTLQATADHRWLTRRGWVTTSGLQPGDLIVTPGRGKLHSKSVRGRVRDGSDVRRGSVGVRTDGVFVPGCGRGHEDVLPGLPRASNVGGDTPGGAEGYESGGEDRGGSGLAVGGPDRVPSVGAESVGEPFDVYREAGLQPSDRDGLLEAIRGEPGCAFGFAEVVAVGREGVVQPVYDVVEVPSTHLFFTGTQVDTPPVAAHNCMDEVNFMQERKDLDMNTITGQAYDLYNATRTRLKSRFLRPGGSLPGIMLLLSSKNAQTSFLEEHMRRLKSDKEDKNTYVSDYRAWDVKSKHRFVLPPFRVEVGDRVARSRILNDDEEPRKGAKVLTIPGEFMRDFREDTEQSLRDIAGEATFNLNPLISERESIFDAVRDVMVHPFKAESAVLDYKDTTQLMESFCIDRFCRIHESRWKPKINPNHPRYVHIDTAVSGDCLGLAMGHVSGMRRIEKFDMDSGLMLIEENPVIIVDFMLRVLPPMGSQIDLSKVRGFLRALRDMGVNIQMVTVDGFESVEMRQNLEKQGFEIKLQSIDRDDAPYVGLRSAFFERRIFMYRYAPFINEVLDLERNVKKKKVDHPVRASTGGKGSKDVSDAVAGVVWACMNDERAHRGVPVVLDSEVRSGKILDPRDAASKEAKEKGKDVTRVIGGTKVNLSKLKREAT